MLLRRALDAEGGVLVGDDVVLVFWVDRLVLRRHVDFFRQQRRPCEVFEEVGVARVREVDVGAGGVAGLAEEGGWVSFVLVFGMGWAEVGVPF